MKKKETHENTYDRSRISRPQRQFSSATEMAKLALEMGRPRHFPVFLENSQFLSESSQTFTEPEDIAGDAISKVSRISVHF